MTIDQFIQKWGTEGASVVLNHLAECVTDDQNLNLADMVAEIATDLKAALNSHHPAKG